MKKSSVEYLIVIYIFLQEYARRIAKVSIDSKMDLDEDTYVSKFKCTLMDVVLSWAKGASFLQICKMTDVFEGMLISMNNNYKYVYQILSVTIMKLGPRFIVF